MEYMRDVCPRNIWRKYIMKRNAKKLLAVFMAVLMVLPLAMPASAKAELSDYCDDPVIYIAGDSGYIYYDNDSKIFCINKAGNLLDGDDEDTKGKVWEATANILLPFILEGIAFDKWDNYYAAVEKEIGELFAPVQLDKNGNVPADSDSGIGKVAQADKKRKMTSNLVSSNGKYTERAYYYNYDWRLDPIELADDLHEYIEGVKKATGRSRVSITSKCLGTNVVLAYINKYGSDSIKGFGSVVATSNGADFLSGAISGDFTLDTAALVRFVNDFEAGGHNLSIHPLIKSTIELLTNTGVIGTLTDTARELLYAKIEYGIISALATSTMMTYPCYWALVTPEDFDKALVYAFGEEGSAKRKQYAGLIEKITVYNETIKKHVDDIMKQIKVPGADGKTTNLAIVSKYGTQMLPIIKDGGIVGDYYVSANKSSLGATTSTIYDTLSDEYIAQRVAEGKGKYISPDKQIDASTCLYPDYTWFIKGCEHGRYPTEERQLVLAVMDADHQLTVNDFDFTQYMVYSYKTGIFEAMTEDNCHNENWTADKELEQPQTKQQKLVSLLYSLFNWLITLVDTLLKKFG